MIGLFGALRWMLKPVDIVLNSSTALIGGILGSPLLMWRLLKAGPKRALTMSALWQVYGASGVPLGKHAIRGLVHFAAPYTASIDPMLTIMNSTHAEAYLVEQPWLTNPFQSVHAVALTNLGEYVSGILITSQIEEVNAEGRVAARGIVTKLSTTFHKKARGKITAKCDYPGIPQTVGEHKLTARSELYDEKKFGGGGWWWGDGRFE